MPQCFIKRCTNRTGLQENREKGIAFYALPSRNKSPERYEKWIQFAGKTEEQGKRTFICSYHFKVGDLDESQLLRQRLLTEVGVKISAPQLKEGAVPSVYIKELTDRCYVKDCSSIKELHPFPHRFNSPDRFNTWVDVCNQDAVPGPRSGICDRHFYPADYQDNSKGVNTLRPGAVPKVSVETNKSSSKVQKKKEQEQSCSIARTRSNKKQTKRLDAKKKPSLHKKKKQDKMKKTKKRTMQGDRRRGIKERAILSSRIRKMFYKTLQKDAIVISDDDSKESEKSFENKIVERAKEENSQKDDDETLNKYKVSILDDVAEQTKKPVKKAQVKKERRKRKRNVKQSSQRNDNETSQVQDYAGGDAKKRSQTDKVLSNDGQIPSTGKRDKGQEAKTNTAFPLDLSEILNCRVTVVGEKQEFQDVGIQCQMAPEHSGTIYIVGDKTIIHRDVIRRVVKEWIESEEEEPEEMCTVKLIEKVELEEDSTNNGNNATEEQQCKNLDNTRTCIKKKPDSEAENKKVSEEHTKICIKEEPLEDEEHLENMEGFVYIKCEQNHEMEEQEQSIIHEEEYDEHEEYTANMTIKEQPEEEEEGWNEIMNYDEEHTGINNLKENVSYTITGDRDVHSKVLNIKQEVEEKSNENTEHEEEYTDITNIKVEPQEESHDMMEYEEYDEFRNINELKEVKEKSNEITEYGEYNSKQLKTEFQEGIYFNSIEIKEECME